MDKGGDGAADDGRREREEGHDNGDDNNNTGPRGDDLGAVLALFGRNTEDMLREFRQTQKELRSIMNPTASSEDDDT